MHSHVCGSHRAKFDDDDIKFMRNRLRGAGTGLIKIKMFKVAYDFENKKYHNKLMV